MRKERQPEIKTQAEPTRIPSPTRSKDISDGPIWKDGPVLFGILLFPSILLVCLILYLMQTLILSGR